MELTIGLAAALMAGLIGMILVLSGLNDDERDTRQRAGPRRAGASRRPLRRDTENGYIGGVLAASPSGSTWIPCSSGWGSASSRS